MNHIIFQPPEKNHSATAPNSQVLLRYDTLEY